MIIWSMCIVDCAYEMFYCNKANMLWFYGRVVKGSACLSLCSS